MSEILAADRERISQSREIEDKLRTILDVRASNANAYGPQFAHLWELASRRISGGKLLRPRLLVGAFDALTDSVGGNGAPRESALRVAAAIELLHFSFLLHDDVIDEDLYRRGTPNLIGSLLYQLEAGGEGTLGSGSAGKRLHWARSNGILVGNLMLSAAHQVLAREPIGQEARLRLLDLLDHSITDSVVGEHCDVGLSDGIIASDLSTVLEMTRLKTATYTFELPLRAAAILAHAEPRLENALGKVSRHLGMAFQLQDDLLSAFGRSEEHGKDPFSDFREGKETAIIAYARTTNAWASIEPLLGAPEFTNGDGTALQSLLWECGAEHFISSMAQEQIHVALEILSQRESAVPEAVARFILDLVDTLEGRAV
ncbi:polyprenyl synthetase family protein [Actinomycetaceae bacterium L2_0104]